MWILPAGAVKPGTSSSIEIFTADLVIPGPGLQVAFTFKPSLPASQLQLELWCWMEPSNSNRTDIPTGTASMADDTSGFEAEGSGSGARATEFGAGATESGAGAAESRARATESGAGATESGARGCDSGSGTSASRVTARESGVEGSEWGGRGSESGARMLAMLQADGAVMVTNEQELILTDGHGARAVAHL